MGDSRTIAHYFADALKFDSSSPTAEDIEEHLNQLRILTLKFGIPDVKIAAGSTSVRERVWKCFLRTGNADVGTYLSLVDRGKSSVYDKIKRDIHRLITSDQPIYQHVPTEKFERLLNAFIHYKEDKKLTKISYVQGMNAIAAPLLYALPEPDAFFAFVRIITKHCPMYFSERMEGVYAGTTFIDDILRTVDPQLHKHLKAHHLPPSVWAFPRLLSFCASDHPLFESLHLWDFFFAFGLHLVVPAVVSQAILHRKELLKTTKPLEKLQEHRSLDAKQTIKCIRDITKKISENQHSILVLHMMDHEVAQELVPIHVKGK